MKRLSVMRKEARCLKMACIPFSHSFKSVMFSANDPAKHSVVWLEEGDCWAVVSDKDGLIKVHEHIGAALNHMHVATTMGISYENAVKTPELLWSIRDNPYY